MGIETFFPKLNNEGTIGKPNRAWKRGYFKDLSLGGIDYELPTTDGTANQILKTDGAGNLDWTSAGAATAFDDIADPDAAGTIAMTTYAQTITSTKTDGDMINIQGLGSFGDISVVRIESKTGNPTDGTVLEVVSHDVNVDPLLVSTSAQVNAFKVGQTGIVSSVGVMAPLAGVSPGTATDSAIKTDTIELSNADIKALRGTKKELVATPGADYFVELISAVLILDYGSEVLTESVDNLVIQYATSGVDATAAIEMTGFIDSTADIIAVIPALTLTGVAATNLVNNALELFNTGDGEFGGNASNDTTMTVKVNYRVHKAGL